ncbi:NAD(P)-dependent oxidoreductase [Dietzia alimentaria]|uniref:NAD(P)-dependent oxidoreductase n=1 Tax=Dietzia alimentaria TaxID=665550 RepID=UPI00029A1175|nr:NAD(P)H-binding protein [Dietzia alimentaria]
MTRLVVFGGTGFTGSHVITEAVRRGIDVVAVARHEPKTQTEGVTVITGDAGDPEVRAQALEGADAVLLAMSPAGAMLEQLRGLYADIADQVPREARVVVMGGWSSLHGSDGKRQIENWPDDGSTDHRSYEVLGAIADDLQARDDELAWTYLTPPNWYGAKVPDQRVVGSYRLGGETPLAPRDGEDHTWISGEDMARAILDQFDTRDTVRSMVNVAA